MLILAEMRSRLGSGEIEPTKGDAKISKLGPSSRRAPLRVGERASGRAGGPKRGATQAGSEHDSAPAEGAARGSARERVNNNNRFRKPMTKTHSPFVGRPKAPPNRESRPLEPAPTGRLLGPLAGHLIGTFERLDRLWSWAPGWPASPPSLCWRARREWARDEGLGGGRSVGRAQLATRVAQGGPLVCWPRRTWLLCRCHNDGPKLAPPPLDCGPPRASTLAARASRRPAGLPASQPAGQPARRPATQSWRHANC